MKKIVTLIIVWVVLSFCRLFAYDYPWPVDYNIKNKPLEEINEIVWDFICENPEFHVYKVDRTTYEVGSNNDSYELLLEFKEYKPFGHVLQGTIYLKDVVAVVHFCILHISGKEKNYIRLFSYCTDLELVEGNINRKRWGKYTSFNDAEPTKKEIPIKKSFEKNFLSKLDLEWEYEKPFLLDRGLSKLMSLFRKRKDFSDD
ncbi:MAG: hypothetical protein IKP51_00610 [Treponema sp.]|nr:hypothetical protein [Treponema sp.]